MATTCSTAARMLLPFPTKSRVSYKKFCFNPQETDVMKKNSPTPAKAPMRSRLQGFLNTFFSWIRLPITRLRILSSAAEVMRNEAMMQMLPWLKEWQRQPASMNVAQPRMDTALLIFTSAVSSSSTASFSLSSTAIMVALQMTSTALQAMSAKFSSMRDSSVSIRKARVAMLKNFLNSMLFEVDEKKYNGILQRNFSIYKVERA